MSGSNIILPVYKVGQNRLVLTPRITGSVDVRAAGDISHIPDIANIAQIPAIQYGARNLLKL